MVKMAKYLIVILFLTVAVACTRRTRVPCICQRNLDDCLMAYDHTMAHDSWKALCHQDFLVCKEGRGM
jgi:carbonic anhydrase